MCLYSNVYNFFSEKHRRSFFRGALHGIQYCSWLHWKNPILGNGFISNQWNGGGGIFSGILSGRYWLVGEIFLYSVLLGTCLIYLPYYFSLQHVAIMHSNHVFFKTIEYMLLFFLLSMFFSAVNIRDSSSIMFLVCLLYYFRYDYFGSGDLLLSETVIAWNMAWFFSCGCSPGRDNFTAALSDKHPGFCLN